MVKKKKARIWIINASPRSISDCPQGKSKSERIAEFMNYVAKKGKSETVVTNLYDYEIGSCKACVSTVFSLCHYPCDCYPNIKYPNDPMLNFYKIGEWADAIIFVTPVHWWNTTTRLNAFLGRLECIDGGNTNPQGSGKDVKAEIAYMNSGKFHPKKHWAGKVAGIYTISESTTGASDSLFKTLNWCGFWIPPHSIVEMIIGTEYQYHQHDKALDNNACAWNAAKNLVHNIIDAVNLVGGKKLRIGDIKCLR